MLQSPQTQKMKLKILGEQFEAERNAKMHKLKPKIIGCIWEGAGNSFPEFGEYTLASFATYHFILAEFQSTERYILQSRY